MSEYTVSRDSQRVPLETRVQLKFEWFGGFISEYSSNISPGGMFIRTQTPEPVGRLIGFELRLGDGYELIRGTGEVMWVRPMDQGPDKPAGMGIRFLEISPEGRELIYQMVDNFIAAGGTPFDVTRTPTGTHTPAAAPQAVSPPAVQAAAAAPERRAAPPAPALPMAAAPSRPAPPPGTAGAAGAAEVAAAVTAAVAAAAPRSPMAPILPAPAIPAIPPALPRNPMPQVAAAAVERNPPPPIPAFAPEAPAEPRAALSAGDSYAPPFAAASATPTSRRGSRLVLWVAVGGALALAASLAIFHQEALLGWFLPPKKPVVAALPAAPPARHRTPTAAATAAASPAASSPSSAPSALRSPAAAPASAGGATTHPAAPSVPSAAPVAAPGAAPSPAATAPASAASPASVGEIQKITWKQNPDGTDVTLWADGAFRRQDWAHFRIDADPPRELVKLYGIRHPFASTRLLAHTQQLLQVRTGYHDENRGNELHVVLDLTGSGVEVTGIEAEGEQLHIHLKGK